ncbi:hypothetical protein VARIO8X_140010 [Burkholderiales bacterium 8X]|nr:hypothetical protein VARIO8X_140010 [Burkholderiales bacterium 8X]
MGRRAACHLAGYRLDPDRPHPSARPAAGAAFCGAECPGGGHCNGRPAKQRGAAVLRQPARGLLPGAGRLAMADHFAAARPGRALAGTDCALPRRTLVLPAHRRRLSQGRPAGPHQGLGDRRRGVDALSLHRLPRELLLQSGWRARPAGAAGRGPQAARQRPARRDRGWHAGGRRGVLSDRGRLFRAALRGNHHVEHPVPDAGRNRHLRRAAEAQRRAIRSRSLATAK